MAWEQQLVTRQSLLCCKVRLYNLLYCDTEAAVDSAPKDSSNTIDCVAERRSSGVGSRLGAISRALQ